MRRLYIGAGLPYVVCLVDTRMALFMSKIPLLGAFAKLRQATASFFMSVCTPVLPSVCLAARMEQLGSH
jgi:hypothetical protein